MSVTWSTVTRSTAHTTAQEARLDAGPWWYRPKTAPPAIAALVAEAVELARKVEGYHIGPGAAVSMMAMETLTQLNGWPDVTAPSTPGEAEPGNAQAGDDAAGASTGASGADTEGSLLGDEQDLRREVGRFWQEAQEQAEAWHRRRPLVHHLPKVIFEGAPAEDVDAHRKVVFWSAVQGRLDAVRGRLPSFMQASSRLDDLHFAGLGHYARERLGLTAREAAELVRLHRALEELPVAQRMYAAGRLVRRKAWLVTAGRHAPHRPGLDPLRSDPHAAAAGGRGGKVRADRPDRCQAVLNQ